MSLSPYPKPVVGMEVYVHWYAIHYAHRGNKATIIKVGRKWAELSNHELIDISSDKWLMDGKNFSSPGACFPSKEHYLQTIFKQEQWILLKNKMGWTSPSGVSVADIEQAAKLLGIELNQ
jgi:hypothetical protein